VQDPTILYIIQTTSVSDGLSFSSEMAQSDPDWTGRLIDNAVTAFKVIFMPNENLVTPGNTFGWDV
jgi:hypothetical protein